MKPNLSIVFLGLGLAAVREGKPVAESFSKTGKLAQATKA